MVKRLVGRVLLTAVTCLIITLAGGGWAFLRRPVGVPFLCLWIVWWTAIALGRPRGVRSAYDRRQRWIMALGATALLLLMVAAPWEYAHLPGPLPRDGILSRVGLAVFAAGIGLHSAAMWALRGLYTSRLGRQPGHRLVRGGAYRWVRHPGYASNVLSMIGIGFALSSIVALATTAATVPLILRRIDDEEKMLLAEFGDEYRTYVERTAWRLIPRVY